MDKYLEMMFADTERIKQAIEKGVEKRMRWAVLNELCDPKYRAQWCLDIYRGEYEIEEPYMMGIPKPHTYDPETKKPEQRPVVVCSNIDRTFFSMYNDITFELCGKDMVHPSCMSYQKGIGCGKVVKRCTEQIRRMSEMQASHTVGVKLDLSKYFPSAPRWLIMQKFDEIERITGPSACHKVVRDFYNNDRIWNKMLDVPEPEQHVVEYQGLKQGVAVASFLADACLYDMDKRVCEFDVFYVRYSDDMLIIGPDWKRALRYVERYLQTLGMKLNPKKVEVLDDRKWFKFLGFNIKGESVTLAANRLDTFKKKVQAATIKRLMNRGVGTKIPVNDLLRSVYRELYGTQASPYSWAGGVLPVINNEHDIMEMNRYVLDCVRAAANGHTWVSGLGCDMQMKDGCLKREDDKWHHINEKAIGELEGYNTVGNMLQLMNEDSRAFRMEVREMYRKTAPNHRRGRAAHRVSMLRCFD